MWKFEVKKRNVKYDVWICTKRLPKTFTYYHCPLFINLENVNNFLHTKTHNKTILSCQQISVPTIQAIIVIYQILTKFTKC